MVIYTPLQNYAFQVLDPIMKKPSVNQLTSHLKNW